MSEMPMSEMVVEQGRQPSRLALAGKTAWIRITPKEHAVAAESP